MTTRVRRYLGASVLLLAAPLASPSTPAVALPTEACNPTTGTEAALCATYDVAVLAAGTETPVATSQSPFDLRVTFANTSGSVQNGVPTYVKDTNRARWVKRISTTLVSQGDRAPIVARSTDLPHGLLVAGSAANCAPGADFSFSSCTAGHGTAWVKAQRLGAKELRATFGIQRIFHNRTLATEHGHYAVLQADISYCIDTNGGAASCERGETLSHAVAVNRPASGQTWQLPFELPLPSDWGLAGANDVQAIGLDSVVVRYRGQSDQLVSGPASGQFTLMKLPMRCGVADLSATVTSETAGTVRVARSLEITRCSQIKKVKSTASVVAGRQATITGILQDYDSGARMGGTEITIRSCNIAFSVPCGFTTAAQLTQEDGSFSFTVKPMANTHYFVRVPPVDGKPEQWVLRRIDVAPKIVLRASRSRMASGGNVTLSGLVKPAHDGLDLTIQRKVGNRWVTLTTARLDGDSAFTVPVTLTGSSGSKAKLRALLPAHNDHLQGTSPKVVVAFR